MAVEHAPKRRTRRTRAETPIRANTVSALSLLDKDVAAISENVLPDGTRVNFLPKEELKFDVERLREYKRLGYAIEEREYDYRLSMPQKQFEETIEKKQHEDHRERMRRSQHKDADGFESTMSYGDPTKVDDFLDVGGSDDDD